MKSTWGRKTTEDLVIGDYIPITKPSMNYKMSLQGAQHGFFLVMELEVMVNYINSTNLLKY